MKFILSHPRIKNTLICLVSGILLGLSFPPFKTWFFVYFGMILLLYLMLSAERLRQAFIRGYFAMLFFNVFTLYWIGGWGNNDIFLKIGGAATDVIHPFFFLVPLLIFYGIKKLYKPGFALMLFPLIWTGFEYSHNLGELAFPWIELGNTETYNIHRIQYAELVGVHGITFLICVISVMLYYLIHKLYSKKWKIISKPVILFFGVIVMMLFFPNFYSYNYLINTANYERYFTPEDSSKIIKTAIIQLNINPFNKWLSNKDSLVDSYIEKLNQSLKLNADLVVIHETSVPYYFLEDYNAYNTQKYIDFVNLNNKPLLMGVPNIQYYPDSATAPPETEVMSISSRRYGVYNSAILLEPGQLKNEYQIHKKVKLVPFSEHAPFQRYLPFMKKLVSWGVGISSWNPGDSLILFNLKQGKINVKFATLICFESVFSDYVSEGVKKGAEFLVIITNDGWWGNNGGPVQHEQFAVLRAVENRKWVVRAAQTGISCYIDPLGNIYDEIPYDTEGMTVKKIYANSDQTFYSEHGDVTGMLSYYVEILSFLLCIVLYVKKKRDVKRAA
jgi:apolipoprotein N-acyltransferase